MIGEEIMKREIKPLSWKVKNFNCNRQVIEDYDILRRREDFIKKLKKKCENKEEFAEALRHEMMYHFWSRAEWELIIEITEDNRVLLKPWVGCYDDEKATVDVTDDTTFDWMGFAKHHIGKQRYKNEAKIDVYDQIMWTWPQMAEYCWYTRLKYERDHPKFHE